MIKHNQDGAVNAVVLSLVLAIILLIGAVVFGGWAYSSREDYKNNVQAKINSAVVVSNKKQQTIDTAQFAEEAKLPLKTYYGPEAYGSLVLNYPKTWSGYVDDTGSSGNNVAVDGYFNPGVVPSISSPSSVFALRVQVLNQPYSQTLQNFSNQNEGQNTLTISAYALPKLPKIVGVEIAGIQNNQQTTMVVLPVRSQTIEIWTEGDQYLSDFNQTILPNFSFSP